MFQLSVLHLAEDKERINKIELPTLCVFVIYLSTHAASSAPLYGECNELLSPARSIIVRRLNIRRRAASERKSFCRPLEERSTPCWLSWRFRSWLAELQSSCAWQRKASLTAGRRRRAMIEPPDSSVARSLVVAIITRLTQ